MWILEWALDPIRVSLRGFGPGMEKNPTLGGCWGRHWVPVLPVSGRGDLEAEGAAQLGRRSHRCRGDMWVMVARGRH